MHLQELIPIRVSIHLLYPQFLNQCNVALFQMLNLGQLGNLLHWFNPSFEGALIFEVGLNIVSVNLFDR